MSLQKELEKYRWRKVLVGTYSDAPTHLLLVQIFQDKDEADSFMENILKAKKPAMKIATNERGEFSFTLVFSLTESFIKDTTMTLESHPELSMIFNHGVIYVTTGSINEDKSVYHNPHKSVITLFSNN